MKNVVIAPIITEKSMQEEENGAKTYTFEVARFARKEQIKKELKRRFNVSVVSITTTAMKGRRKRVGKMRIEVPTGMWKKATVKLEKGQTLSMFEQGA